MSMSVSGIRGDGSVALPLIVDVDDCIDLTSVGSGITALSLQTGRLVTHVSPRRTDYPSYVQTVPMAVEPIKEARQQEEKRLIDHVTVGALHPILSKEEQSEVEVRNLELHDSDKYGSSSSGEVRPTPSPGGTMYQKAMRYRNRRATDVRSSIDPVISVGSELSSTGRYDKWTRKMMISSKPSQTSHEEGFTLSKDMVGILSNESLVSAQGDTLETLLSNLENEASAKENPETDTTVAQFCRPGEDVNGSSNSSDSEGCIDSDNKEEQETLELGAQDGIEDLVKDMMSDGGDRSVIQSNSAPDKDLTFERQELLHSTSAPSVVSRSDNGSIGRMVDVSQDDANTISEEVLRSSSAPAESQAEFKNEVLHSLSAPEGTQRGSAQTTIPSKQEMKTEQEASRQISSVVTNAELPAQQQSKIEIIRLENLSMASFSNDADDGQFLRKASSSGDKAVISEIERSYGDKTVNAHEIVNVTDYELDDNGRIKVVPARENDRIVSIVDRRRNLRARLDELKSRQESNFNANTMDTQRSEEAQSTNSSPVLVTEEKTDVQAVGTHTRKEDSSLEGHVQSGTPQSEKLKDDVVEPGDADSERSRGSSQEERDVIAEETLKLSREASQPFDETPEAMNLDDTSAPIVNSRSGYSKSPKGTRKSSVRLDMDEFKEVVMSGKPVQNIASMDPKVMELIDGDDELVKVVVPGEGYHHDLAITDSDCSSSDSSITEKNKTMCIGPPSMSVPLSCKEGFPYQARGLTGNCHQDNSEFAKGCLKEGALSPRSRTSMTAMCSPRESETTSMYAEVSNSSPPKEDYEGKISPGGSSIIEDLHLDVDVREVLEHPIEEVTEDSQSSTQSFEEMQESKNSIIPEEATVTDAEASNTGDEYYTTEHEEGEHTDGSYSGDTDSKVSLTDSKVSLRSDFYNEGDLYESYSVPFVVRMLDKSCAWLEERNDKFACGAHPPSLLSKSKTPGNSRVKTELRKHKHKSSGLVTEVANSPSSMAFFRRAKEAQVDVGATYDKTETPRAANLSEQENEVKGYLQKSGTTQVKARSPRSEANTQFFTGAVEASTTNDSLTSILGEVKENSRRWKEPLLALDPGSPHSAKTLPVGSHNFKHRPRKSAESSETPTGTEILSQLEHEISSLKRSGYRNTSPGKFRIVGLVAQKNSLEERYEESQLSQQDERESTETSGESEDGRHELACTLSDEEATPGTTTTCSHLGSAPTLGVEPVEQSSFQARLQARLERIRGKEGDNKRLEPEEHKVEKLIPTITKQQVEPEGIQPPMAGWSSEGKIPENREDVECETHNTSCRVSPEVRQKEKPSTVSKMQNTGLKTIKEDPSGSGTDNDNGNPDFYAALTENERLAALELAEKLRRRAATLKRRRKLRARRQTQPSPSE